jgi:hypothetical protein
VINNVRGGRTDHGNVRVDGLHQLHGIGIVNKGEEQMLGRYIAVRTLLCRSASAP